MLSLHDASLSLSASIRELQRFDAFYETYGEAYPEFRQTFSSAAYSLLYTNFGLNQAPALNNNHWQGVRGKLLQAFEKRAITPQAQPVAARLERILDHALGVHGEEKVVGILAAESRIACYGASIIRELQHGGVTFKDSAYLRRLFDKARYHHQLAQPKIRRPRR
jgi:hypothetical protein